MMRVIPRRAPRLLLPALALLLILATATTTLALTRSEQHPPPPSTSGPLRIAVIGDSYSSGLDNAVVWPTLIAESSDLSISNLAVPGSGYVGGAGESGPFSAQVDKALATKPDLIVVFGGINDVGKSVDLINQSATDLFFELARRAPEVPRIVFGPLWHEDPPPEVALTIDAAINRAADQTSSPYVRLIDKTWLVGPGLIQDDGIHPTDQGQTIIASELAGILQTKIREQQVAGR